MTTPSRVMARSFPLDRSGPSFDMSSFPVFPLGRTFAHAGFKAVFVRLGYLLFHRPTSHPEGEDRSQQNEADSYRSLRFSAFDMFVHGVAVSEVVNALELVFAHGSSPFRGCDWEPRSPRGPWPAFRRLSGRPGGIRTRTSPLLPGAPSGHAYFEFHEAERYNSRSSHTLSKISHSSHGRANFTDIPVYQIPAIECGTSRADRYISRPTRPMHPLAFGICCARLNLVWKRLNLLPLKAR